MPIVVLLYLLLLDTRRETLLTIWGSGLTPKKIVFGRVGSPSSFLLFDVPFDAICPHSGMGHLESLSHFETQRRL